ncbi:MAG: DUF5348 domain-containing protein [Alkaliphilus sp.]
MNKRLKLELELMAESVDQLRRDLNKLSDIIYNNVYVNCSCEEEKKEINKILEYVEWWDSRVEDIEYEVLRESKETKEDFLALNSYLEKYSVGKNGLFLSCGCSVELYLYDQIEEYFKWMRGRVESSREMGGYYFMSDETKDITLEDGMKARIRV